MKSEEFSCKRVLERYSFVLLSLCFNDIAKIRNRRRGIWHFCALTYTFMHFFALKYTFMTFLSGFSEIVKDGADLASGEILAMGVIAGALQLLAELGNAVDPTHQVAGGGARVAVGEVKHCKLLLAVTADFHFYQKLKLKKLFYRITYFSKTHPSSLTLKGGSTSHPKPLSPQKRGDVTAPFNSLYDPFGSPCRGQKRRSEPLRSKVGGPSKVSPEFFVGWRFKMLGVTLEDRVANADVYDFIYGTYEC